jgi:hypothetical protein
MAEGGRGGHCDRTKSSIRQRRREERVLRPALLFLCPLWGDEASWPCVLKRISFAWLFCTRGDMRSLWSSTKLTLLIFLPSRGGPGGGGSEALEADTSWQFNQDKPSQRWPWIMTVWYSKEAS